MAKPAVLLCEEYIAIAMAKPTVLLRVEYITIAMAYIQVLLLYQVRSYSNCNG